MIGSNTGEKQKSKKKRMRNTRTRITELRRSTKEQRERGTIIVPSFFLLGGVGGRVSAYIVILTKISTLVRLVHIVQKGGLKRKGGGVCRERRSERCV